MKKLDKPVAELQPVAVSTAPAPRVAGLLKGKIHWACDAFAPMTDDELADFISAPPISKPKH